VQIQDIVFIEHYSMTSGVIKMLIINGEASRVSSDSIVSDYELDNRAIEVRSPAEVKGFFL
jgi:hypothetical protein